MSSDQALGFNVSSWFRETEFSFFSTGSCESGRLLPLGVAVEVEIHGRRPTFPAEYLLKPEKFLLGVQSPHYADA